MKLHRHDPDHLWRSGVRGYKTPHGWLPGVTSVLKETKPDEDRKGLEKWKREVGEHEAKKVLKMAGHRGTKMHEWVEGYLLRGEDGPWLDPYWESIEPVLRKIDDVHLIEGAVWHPGGWAGTVDCVARYEGELVTLDWKSKRPPKKRYRQITKREFVTDYLIQAGAAYPLALEHVYPDLGRLPGLVVIACPGYKAQVERVEPGEFDGQWLERVRLYHTASKVREAFG